MTAADPAVRIRDIARRVRLANPAKLMGVAEQYLTRLNSKRVTTEHVAKTERALGRVHRHVLDEGVDPLAVPYHVAQGYLDVLVGEVSLQTVKKTHLTAISAAYRFAQDLGTRHVRGVRLLVHPAGGHHNKRALAALADRNGALSSALGTLAAGSILLAIACLIGSSTLVTWAGWVLIVSAVLAWYTAMATMLEAVLGQTTPPPVTVPSARVR
jgi:hypothetical protein